MNIRPTLTRASFFIRHLSINRPPLPLPREDQREFEQLQRNAMSSQPSGPHPDASAPTPSEFDGDVNPTTGEKGGPKREPIRRSAADPGGDWSFKGRVSDF